MGYTEEIRLNAKNASLILVVDRRAHFDWSTVHVLSSMHDEAILIGCSTLEKFEARFIEAFKPLTGPRPNKFTWHGKTMFEIIVLEAPHAVMAVEEMYDGGLEINIMDIDGNFLPSIYVTRDDMDRWLKVLEEYRLNHPWNVQVK